MSEDESGAVGTALAERDNSPSAMVERYRADFAQVLPSHIKSDTWVRLAVGALRRDSKLREVAAGNPGSLMRALLEAARLGHEPGTEAYYLVPFGNEVQGIEGYRGIVERIYRAGAVSSVKAEIVYAGDHFEWRPNEMEKPVHEFDPFADDRGAVKGAYAYCVMHDGATSRVCVINNRYIEKVRKMSRGSNRADSPWQKWPEAMILKTVVRRLEAWVPTSAEYMKERLRAASEAQAAAPSIGALPATPPPSAPAIESGDEHEVIDPEVVDPADNSWPEVTPPGSG